MTKTKFYLLTKVLQLFMICKHGINFSGFGITKIFIWFLNISREMQDATKIAMLIST